MVQKTSYLLMKRTTDRTQSHPRCMLCGKGAVMAYNRPHSLKHTKRMVKPNLQSFYGLPVCTRCLRTLKSQNAANGKVAEQAAAAPTATEATAEVAA